jgi:hypothetical protein
MTTTEPTDYVVIAPCVITKGERGSQGTFYQGTLIRTWICGDGDDRITAEHLQYLLDLGSIRPV